MRENYDRSFWISALSMLVLTMAMGFAVHGLLLEAEYSRLPTVMRPLEGAMQHFHYQLIAHVLIAFGITWIFRRGISDGPWLGQGLRFGIAWAVAVPTPFFLIYHAVAQFPFSLTWKQIVLEAIAAVILGVVLAFLNRRPQG